MFEYVLRDRAPRRFTNVFADIVSRKLRRFGRREDGGMLIFGLYIFVLMVAFAGMAVDLVRHEALRTELQNTVDRAALAGGSLTQSLDPKAVVEDYFEKAGLSEYLIATKSDSGLNYRTVSVTAGTKMPTLFMNFMGIDDIGLATAGTATQRINNVEISLVLDISNSMNSYNRLTNLKAAAKEFVTTVLNNSDGGRVSISIVPYSGHVNLGKELMAQYAVTKYHDYSYCAELASTDFSSISMSTTSTRTQAMHFDPWAYASTPSTFQPSTYFCMPQSADTVMPFSTNEGALHTKIDALVADGNTSIDIGMKWGSVLLDPNSQGVITNLISNGVVGSEMAGRPLNPAQHDVLKVVVLMTDGENTTQYAINSNYRSGLSRVYRRNSDGRLSIYHSSVGKYYSPVDNAWYSSPVGGSSGSTRLSWADLWATVSVDYVAWYLYAVPLSQNYSNWWSTFLSSQYTAKDSRLNGVCDAAKAAGITVYGIAFEAPAHGQQVIQNCASSAAHYFDVQGLEIKSAFRSIAVQISKLRLTQ